MSEICQVCGLPSDLCVCETIAKETQRIRVTTTKRKYGKVYTIINGIDQREIDIKDLTKQLKTKFACGGTTKEGVIELQGDHKSRIKKYLVKTGFSPETIDVK
ncbi:MAG: Protein translation factor SUI1 [Candidatus Woesearchaeota archaeon]|nr:Protein translation factor SUI1 [Candidatus Woesearchaeota archaeon]